MANKRKPTHRKHHRLHDYKSRCIYHITLVVSDRVPLLGRLVGETVDVARVEFSPLGQEIAQNFSRRNLMQIRNFGKKSIDWILEELKVKAGVEVYEK